MGVDAQMAVRLVEPIADNKVIDASYRLAEACGKSDAFFVSDDAALQRGDVRRALNRPDEDDCGYIGRGLMTPNDPHWLVLSLWGRYYGPSYERGDLWRYVAIAEWLERNFPGCTVYYGGDSDSTLEVFDGAARQRLIAHWAEHGGRPYYQHRGWGEPHALTPTCPLCQRRATQYGSGGQFASWTCDGCSRHWVWTGGDVRAYPPSSSFDSFDAAKQQREEAAANAGS